MFIVSIFLSLFLTAPIAQAQTPKATKTIPLDDPIIRKFSDSVVHITIEGPEQFASYGSGFFISPDGWIMTNYHVIEPLLLAPAERKITILLSDGSRIPEIRIAKCDITESWLDLCLIKINHYPKNWFRIAPFRPEIGTEIHSIWRDSKSIEKYSRSSGFVKGYNTQFSWTLLDTTAKIVPGQSGAPLFTKDGKISAVAAMISSSWNALARKKQRVVSYQYFGVSADEVVKFTNGVSDFFSVNDYLNAHPIVRTMKNFK